MTDWQPEDGAVAHGGGVQTTALLVLAGQGRSCSRMSAMTPRTRTRARGARGPVPARRGRPALPARPAVICMGISLARLHQRRRAAAAADDDCDNGWCMT